MSKRDLKKYLCLINKEELENQIIELYDKFNNVKTYYDFVFNPKEDKLIQEAKVKISHEYFPKNSRKPKMRRSVAQKIIKHYITLGVDSFIITDIMLYNIEIAQTYTAEKPIKSELFYKSMLQSFNQALNFMIEKGVFYEFINRVEGINEQTIHQNWMNCFDFQSIIERLK
jgi:hypothetical protein